MKCRFPLCILSFIAWLGCSGEPNGEEESIQEQKARLGLISVNYGHDWGESGKGMLLTTAAQFIQYTALNQDQVARLLALPLDPSRDLPAQDKCVLFSTSLDFASEADLTSDEQGRVDLVEAGNLVVQMPSHSITLTPRHFPGLLPFISGVIYSDTQTVLVEETGKVRASSRGAETIGPFSAQIVSPTLPRLTRIGNAEPAPRISVQRSNDLTLNWQVAAVDPAIATNDILYLELRYSKGSKEMALRCRPKDDGVFLIPAEYLFETTGNVILEIARLRRTLFSAPGLEQGELRVTVRDIAVLQ